MTWIVDESQCFEILILCSGHLTLCDDLFHAGLCLSIVTLNELIEERRLATAHGTSDEYSRARA